MKSCVFIRNGVVSESLNQSSVDGKRMLDPFNSFTKGHGAPISILEDKNVSNDAEVHRGEDDLWICISGEVDFIVGGKLHGAEMRKRPDGTENDMEFKAPSIVGGTRYTLKAGDILYIPAGQPHSHETKGEARLFIIKPPAREAVPLSEVPGWEKGE